MSNIHVLSQDTINKIAAGEVIERPMAVVKELIENAIDAGSNSITVEIKEGGKSLIRITDNGTGMEEDDIKLAFTPHATSKIDSAQDLLAVSTLGFRGEALASIASVSQMEMVTKTREALMGTRYCIDGGTEKDLESVGCPEGTTFLIRNLFYNTPARLKFLKTPQTEAGYINGLLERMALSHPEIAFRFLNQNQNKLHTSGNGNLKDVIYHIFGREITSNLVELDSQEVTCRVKGFIGKPVVSRGNRTFMIYFINGRYIKSTTIQKAIEDAYQPYSMQHRYPFTVLHFQIDTSKIDINVHPQKMEIRFTDAKAVYQSVYHAVSEALKKKEYIPEVTWNQSMVKESAAPYVSSKPTPSMASKPTQQNNPQMTAKSEKQTTSPLLSKPERRTNPVSLPQPAPLSMQEQISVPVPKVVQVESLKEKPRESVEAARKLVDQPKAHKPEQETLFGEGILSQKAQKEVKIIGQVFATYWILEYEKALYLVDQHAAHEKVLYERFMKDLEHNKVATQMLQPPIILTLSMTEQEAVEHNMDVFEKLGYQMESFGGREYAVTGVPAHLPDVGEETLLLEVIDSLSEEHGHSAPELLLNKVASMSCKAAVKGNNQLPMEQMRELLTELMGLDNPYHCPHGRPTMIKMTKQELDKRFKRIV